MSPAGRVYECHYDYKMDPKFRVSIPVAFRPEGDEPVRLQASKVYEERVIKIFSLAAFEDKFRKINESDLPPGKKEQMAGALRMTSKQVSISTQGKLSVPKDWAESIGLVADGPVKVAGRDSYFILCSEESFRRIVEGDMNMDDEGLGVL